MFFKSFSNFDNYSINMNLIFDFGNSFTKYFFVQNNMVVERGSFVSRNFDQNILDINSKANFPRLIFSF